MTGNVHPGRESSPRSKSPRGLSSRSYLAHSASGGLVLSAKRRRTFRWTSGGSCASSHSAASACPLTSTLELILLGVSPFVHQLKSEPPRPEVLTNLRG